MNLPRTEMGKFWAANKHRAVVTYSAYRERVVKKNMSFEEALVTENMKGAMTDAKYKKWSKIAKKNGIHYTVFYNRVRKYGWSHKRAATEPTRVKRKNGMPKIDMYYTNEDAHITKESDKEVKEMVLNMIESNVPVPKKYVKRFPELFKGGA